MDESAHLSLASAAIGGCTETIRVLLNAGVNIDKVEITGKTALHHALQQGKDITACFLLERGANWQMLCEDGVTSLHCAAMGGSTRAAQILLDAGACIDQVNGDGKTPLQLALNKKKDDTACLLLQRGANWKTVNQNGAISLLYVVQQHCIKALRWLLDSGAYIDGDDESGKTALQWALENGRNEIAYLLLQRGANVHQVDNYGRTPLHLAAKTICYSEQEVAPLILELGANINQHDKNKNTPLHVAVTNNNSRIACLLIERGANVLMANCKNQTPLQIIISKDNNRLIQSLLEYKFNSCTNFNFIDYLQAFEWENKFYCCDTILMYLVRGGHDVQNLKNPLSEEALYYYRHYLAEISRMSSYILYEGISLLDLFRMTKTRLASVVSNKNLLTVFGASDYVDSETFYSKLVIELLQKARMHAQLLGFARETLNLIFEQDVTYVVSTCILEYLTETELRTLKRVYKQITKTKDCCISKLLSSL